MMRRTLGELRATLPILVPGGIGALIVVRALLVYWGSDWPATLIVLAMAAGLALGLSELFARQLRATQLDRELQALPRVADESTLEVASPLLSAMLRARLEQAPPPTLGDGIAPFLSGLLVMLGLLGTLLGLFETVNGAGHALTSSADVDTLRRSLSAPIAGLTRSFGCSAAGISASAMLGLAIALVRRREGRTLRAIHAYAAGPMRALSPSARQARAFEQLASQGGALPGAATAIEGVGTQLSALSTQLVALQQSALEAQQRAFTELLASVHGELAKAAVETGKALHSRVSPLLEQLVARSGEALVAQSSTLAEVARNVTHELERDAALRREDAAQAMEAMRSRLDEAERARAVAHAKELEGLSAQLARTVADTERREQALSARWQELVSRFDVQLEAARSSEGERLRSLDAQVSAAREREHEQLAKLDDLGGRVGSELERLSAALTHQLEQRLASERDHDERAERVLAQLTAATGALEAGTARELGVIEQGIARQQGAIENAVERQRAAIEAAVTRQESAWTRVVEHQQAALEAGAMLQQTTLEGVLARQEDALAAGVARQEDAIVAGIARQERALAQLVERLPQAFDEAAASSRTAAQEALTQLVALTEERVSSVSSLLSHELTQRAETARTLDERALRALERAEQSADALDGAIARQGSGLEGLIERVGTLLPTLADAAQAGAASTLARLGELAEAQAARFAKLEAALEREREEHALGLADQLTAHAGDLEQRLAKTSSTVQEAAAIWQASSVEMQAVAELFARSAERQREASDAWLESLGEVEGAVERAGREAARDALSDQLASTQEVFARQLQFQRELFEQLRTLRNGSGRSRLAKGEDDVSVGK
jgi:hypothetical protein